MRFHLVMTISGLTLIAAFGDLKGSGGDGALPTRLTAEQMQDGARIEPASADNASPMLPRSHAAPVPEPAAVGDVPSEAEMGTAGQSS